MSARVAPVAVALDAPDLDTASRWATDVSPYVSTLKVGLQLFCRYGPDVADAVRGGSTAALFLDLKLHDIPATVAGAGRAVARLRPDIVTVHAAGGADMIRAACDALPGCTVAAVTLLTSIDEGSLESVAIEGPALDTVRRRAETAVRAGAGAIVCSPREVPLLREQFGSDVRLITPGVRPAGAAMQDQARVATPEEAIAAGADLLVIGRPITHASDPGAAAAAIAAAVLRATSRR